MAALGPASILCSEGGVCSRNYRLTVQPKKDIHRQCATHRVKKRSEPTLIVRF